MWVRTQDGKTTIKVDRFTVEQEKRGVVVDEIRKRFVDHDELEAFLKDNPELEVLSKEVVYWCNPMYPWDDERLHVKLGKVKRKGFIKCGDVILGEYSSLEEAEKVRTNCLEALILHGGLTILFMPKETDDETEKSGDETNG